MNKARLQEIKDRCEAATPGPWYVCPYTGWIQSENPYGKGEMHLADIRGWGHLTGKGQGACSMDDDEAYKIQKANAEFIAHARQDIPALLTYIDEVTVFMDTFKKHFSAGFECISILVKNGVKQ